MAESVLVRWLFVTMLGMADKARSSIIDVPLFILARRAGMTEDETREALRILMAPDSASRSEKHEGRRVLPVRSDQPERGWEIVNWEDYARQIRSADRRAQIREAVARHRAKSKHTDGSGVEVNVSGEIIANPSVNKKHGGEEVKGSSYLEGGGTGGKPGKRKRKPFVPPTVEEVRSYVAEQQLSIDPEGFWRYFNATEWVDSEGKPVLSWKGKAHTWDQKPNRSGPGAGPGQHPPRTKPLTALSPEEWKGLADEVPVVELDAEGKAALAEKKRLDQIASLKEWVKQNEYTGTPAALVVEMKAKIQKLEQEGPL